MVADDDAEDEDPMGATAVATTIIKLPDPDGKLAKWVDFARKKLARRCKLVADPGPPSFSSPSSSYFYFF
eukprot:3551518-Pyramimonas_sp.AAC.1